MGCDIHMYIEYIDKSRKDEAVKEGRKPYWFNFGDSFNPGRNYIMFAILAGVRGHYKDSFEPKGKIPMDEMGWASRDDAYIYISKEPIQGDYSVNEIHALLWEKRGHEVIRINGKPTWVENPDIHSYSWMNIEELEKTFEIYKVRASEEWGEEIKVPIEYQALLAAMKTLEDDGENEVRVVFWFDN
jgi:hypothetical protein